VTEEKESGFVIEDKTYPIPTLDTFNMDEGQVLYDYSGSVVEDFAPADPRLSKDEQDEHERQILKLAKSPGFKKALLHVAYARGNPGESQSKVREIVGQVNILEATLALYGGDDKSPPEVTPSPIELVKPTASETPSNGSVSGGHSTNDSDPADEIPAPTGTTRSDTSSPLSALST